MIYYHDISSTTAIQKEGKKITGGKKEHTK